MLKKYFLFFALTLLTISIYPWWQTLSLETQLISSISAILLFGVPHGAIDHILWFKGKQNVGVNRLVPFILKYLGLIGIYVILWIILPYLSLLLFFVMSFYHFGQSQFYYLPMAEKNPAKIALYVIWGCSIISAIFFHHYTELIHFFNETEHFALTSNWVTKPLLQKLFLISSVASVLLIVSLNHRSKEIARELLSFIALHLSFYILPPLLAFTLYFTVWHSMGMLMAEYNYLKKKQSNITIAGFIKLLFPLSFISIIGAVGILWFFVTYDFSISPFFLIIIFLSVLTLPHSWVMQKWFIGKNVALEKAS